MARRQTADLGFDALQMLFEIVRCSLEIVERFGSSRHIGSALPNERRPSQAFNALVQRLGCGPNHQGLNDPQRVDGLDVLGECRYAKRAISTPASGSLPGELIPSAGEMVISMAS
jgi:hypothetical protein